MDWTKAKTILIVALLVTNLVLAGAYLFQNIKFDDEAEMQDATIKLLAAKNIYLDTKIPEEQPKMPKLTVQFDTINEDDVNELIESQTPLADAELSDEKLIAVTTQFIKDCGLMTDNVTFQSIERLDDEIKVTYKNYIENVAIEESYILCTLKDGKITEFRRFWLDPVEMSTSEKEVIPAAAALIKFMSENAGAEPIYIQNISLVFWLDSSAFNAESPVTDTAFPAWKILYNDGKVRYVTAWEQ
jgi:regulatory protein YycI of two-component signal transduction system YycFG